jgi:hypothetical protein
MSMRSSLIGQDGEYGWGPMRHAVHSLLLTSQISPSNGGLSQASTADSGSFVGRAGWRKGDKQKVMGARRSQKPRAVADRVKGTNESGSLTDLILACIEQYAIIKGSW